MVTPKTLTAHQLARLLLEGPDLPVVADGDWATPVAYPTVRWWKPGIARAKQRMTWETREAARRHNMYEDDKLKPVEKVIVL